MTFTEIIGTFIYLSTIMLSFGPLPSLYTGIKTKEIKNITLPYLLTGIITAVFRGVYGIKGNDFYYNLGNHFTVAIFNIYLLMFLYIKQNSTGMIYYPISLLTFYFLCYHFLSAYSCLLSAAVISMIWSATSLITLRKTLITKDVEFINIFLSYLSLLNHFFLTTYGFLVLTMAIIIPNTWSSILWIMNIFVYFWAKGYITDENSLVRFLKSIFLVIEVRISDQDMFLLNKSLICL
jgi:hypothetical protein